MKDQIIEYLKKNGFKLVLNRNDNHLMFEVRKNSINYFIWINLYPDYSVVEYELVFEKKKYYILNRCEFHTMDQFLFLVKASYRSPMNKHYDKA